MGPGYHNPNFDYIKQTNFYNVEFKKQCTERVNIQDMVQIDKRPNFSVINKATTTALIKNQGLSKNQAHSMSTGNLYLKDKIKPKKNLQQTSRKLLDAIL